MLRPSDAIGRGLSMTGNAQSTYPLAADSSQRPIRDGDHILQERQSLELTYAAGLRELPNTE